MAADLGFRLDMAVIDGREEKLSVVYISLVALLASHVNGKYCSVHLLRSLLVLTALISFLTLLRSAHEMCVLPVSNFTSCNYSTDGTVIPYLAVKQRNSGS